MELIDQIMIFRLVTVLFWTIAYILIIYKSYKDKSYGMPILALIANLAWEFIYSFTFPAVKPQLYGLIIWFLIDVIMLIQIIKYGPREFNNINQGVFTSFIIIIILVVYYFEVFSYYFLLDYDLYYPGFYLAFFSNLMMSILFISMYIRRRGSRGQSLGIAVSKFIGTLSPTVEMYVLHTGIVFTDLIFMVAILCNIIDLIYIIILRFKIDIWRYFD